jgi:serine palmitoyltransferase
MTAAIPEPSPVPEWVARLLSEANATVMFISSTFMRIPGSKIVVRYIRSSYQNDPIRSFIELCLVFFVVRYLTTPKYSVEKNQLKLTERVYGKGKSVC